MDREKLTTILQHVENAKRDYRDRAAELVLKEPHLFPHLVHMTFDIHNKLSVRAAWILEWICTHHGLELLTPHLDSFCQNIHRVQFSGSIRTCAKICEHIAHAYATKSEVIKNVLTSKHIDLIIKTGFDWLITDQKTAVKAYTMTTLYLLGLKRQWIHPELEHLITTRIIHQSKGCEARGKKILKMMYNRTK